MISEAARCADCTFKQDCPPCIHYRTPRPVSSDRDRANDLMGDLADVMHYAEWRKTRDAIAQALADERRGVIQCLKCQAPAEEAS